MAAMNLFDELPSSAKLDEEILDAAESEGKLKLKQADRILIRKSASIYRRYSVREEKLRGSKRDRSRLAKMAKHLDAFASELADLAAENPTLARWVVYPADLDGFLQSIKTRRDAIRGHLANVRRGDVPGFVPA